MIYNPVIGWHVFNGSFWLQEYSVGPWESVKQLQPFQRYHPFQRPSSQAIFMRTRTCLPVLDRRCTPPHILLRGSVVQDFRVHQTLETKPNRTSNAPEKTSFDEYRPMSIHGIDIWWGLGHGRLNGAWAEATQWCIVILRSPMQAQEREGTRPEGATTTPYN